MGKKAEEEQPAHKATMLDRMEAVNSAVDNWTSERFDAALHAILDDTLRKIGKGLQTSVSQTLYGAPEGLVKSAQGVVASIWRFLQPVLRETIAGAVPGDYNKLLVLAWTTEYPLLWPKGTLCPQPWTWARAYYLYAMFPADKSIFQKFHNPWFYVITGLKLNGYTAVPCFILQFFFIDKSDEVRQGAAARSLDGAQAALTRPLPACARVAVCARMC